jgi:hypothetical protein
MKIADAFRNPFIREWIGFNFLGWLLGMILGPIFYFFVLLVYVPYNLYSILEPVAFSFPVGLGIGIMQQMKLHPWKISSAAWILSTTLGLGIPITFISWFLDDRFGYNVPISAVVLQVILAGIFLGGLQALVLRKQISKSGLWILAYGFGLLAVTTIGGIIAGGAFWAAEPIEEFLYDLGLWFVVELRDGVLLLAIATILPVVAAICIGLPTGVILQQFDNLKSVSEKRSLL